MTGLFRLLWRREEIPTAKSQGGVSRMKRKKWGLCLMLCGLLACSLPAMAETLVVNNGSNPDTRLNMRREPSKDAGSIGKFYSGTEVEWVADAGDGWAEVTIGGGKNCVSGYMMSEYLSEKSAAVMDATRDMEVVSPYGTQSVVVRDRPSNSYNAVAMMEVGDAVRVIGTAGDYCYVQLSDDSVGCLSTSEVN